MEVKKFRKKWGDRKDGRRIRSLTAMAAGFMEMASRLVMSLFVIPKVGWLAACFTDPLAWGSAMIYCMVVFLLLMHTLQRKHRSL